jgi:hypothetical protein
MDIASIRAGGDLQVGVHLDNDRFTVSMFDSDGGFIRRLGVFASEATMNAALASLVDLARDAGNAWHDATGRNTPWVAPYDGTEPRQWHGSGRLDETLGDYVGVVSGGDRLTLTVPLSAWEPNDMLDDPTSVLHAKLTINGLDMHLEAWAVTDYGAEGNVVPVQATVNHDYTNEFDNLCSAVRVDTAFQTTKIAGREYIIVATPHNV